MNNKDILKKPTIPQFEGLSSRFFRDKFYTEKPVRKNGKLILKNNVCHFIPFQESIKSLLEMPDVWTCVDNDHKSNDMFMFDFCDG